MLTFASSLHRLSTFLHWKKKNRPWVRGSTWLLVTPSCGITTGQYHRYIEIKVHFLWSHAPMEVYVYIYFFFHQDVHKVLDALL